MSVRTSDFPLWTSPPILFQYSQTAALVGGTYSFTNAKAEFTPSRPILDNALYLFHTLTFAMDVAELDYLAAIEILPTFNVFLKSDGAAPTLREPVQLTKYFENLQYNLALDPRRDNNAFLGSIIGELNQTPALIGKQSITGVVIITAQEIVDDSYVAAFKLPYGQDGNGRHGKAVHF